MQIVCMSYFQKSCSVDYCVVTRIPSRSNHEMDKVQQFHVQTVWLYISWRLAFHSNREIKIHVYRIRQTANVSGEFLRIENKQLKKVQNDSCGQN